MNKPVAITEYKWRSAEFPLCVLSVSASELARTSGIPLQFWSAEGLGKASGFMCRLPSGLVLLVQEFEHAREHQGSKGPSVLIEATELVERGATKAITEVLALFGLAANQAAWVQSESGVQAAHELIESNSKR